LANLVFGLVFPEFSVVEGVIEYNGQKLNSVLREGYSILRTNHLSYLAALIDGSVEIDIGFLLYEVNDARISSLEYQECIRKIVDNFSKALQS
jgi:hypothetical protein